MEQLTKEWIEMAQLLCKQEAEDLAKRHWKRKNSHPCMKKGQKKYAQSLKGKRAIKKTRATRAMHIKHFNVIGIEKDMIQDFYWECPKGYEVDHIIPLCKGGTHALANLQWLTKEENIRKGRRVDYRRKTDPTCLPG